MGRTHQFLWQGIFLQQEKWSVSMGKTKVTGKKVCQRIFTGDSSGVRESSLGTLVVSKLAIRGKTIFYGTLFISKLATIRWQVDTKNAANGGVYWWSLPHRFRTANKFTMLTCTAGEIYHASLGPLTNLPP